MANYCEHLEQLQEIKSPKAHECEECIKTNSRWVHLRTCQTCGATLCCDSSPNQHATKHFQASGHPVVISAEPREKWAWCYADQKLKKY